MSALTFPDGQTVVAVKKIIDEEDRLILSKAILDELLNTLSRKFARDAEELSRVAVFLSDLTIFVKPKRRLRVVTDEPDNRILECAIKGNAELIVTGDKALLALKSYRNVKIISLRNYLDRE